MYSSSDSTIVKQIFGTGGLEAIGQIASFLGVIAYTTLVPQAVLGSYFLLVAILNAASFISSTGVSINITRRINQTSKPEEELMTATVFEVIVAALLTVCVLLGQPIIKDFVGNGFGISLVVLLPLSMFSLLTGAVLRGEKKNTSAMALRTTQKVTTYSLGSLAILSGFEPVFALVGGLLVGKLLEFSGGIITIDISPEGVPRLDEFKELARQSATLTAAGLGSLGQEWTDTLLIGAILTQELVAVYEIAWRLSAVGQVVTNAVASVFYPRFAEAVNSQNHQKIKNYANKSFFYVSIPMIALFAGTFAIGVDIITIVYGPNYSAAYLPLLVLLAGRFPYSLSRILFQLGYSYNFDAQITRVSISAALLNVIVNAFLIPWIGIVGAAIGSLLSYIALVIFLFQLLSNRVGYPRINQYVPGFIASGVMLVVVRLLSEVIPSNSLYLLSLVFIGGIVFVTVLISLSPPVRSDFINFVDMVKK